MIYINNFIKALLLCLSFIFLGSCIFDEKKTLVKPYLELDVADLDTSSVDTITIYGINEGTADTVIIYQ